MNFIKKLVGLNNGKVIDAIKDSNIKLLKTLIAEGNSITFLYNDLTPIMYVCRTGDEEIFDILIEAGANVENKNSEKITPLMFACSNGNLEIVRKILKISKKNVNDLCEKYYPALMYAIMSEKNGSEIIVELINAGADVNITSGWSSSLSLACIQNKHDIVKILVENGADINKSESLHYACIWNNLESVKYLISKGANLFVKDNVMEESCLAGACRRDNVEVVKEIVKYYSGTKDSWAIQNSSNNYEILKILLENGILFDEYFRVQNNGRNPSLKNILGDNIKELFEKYKSDENTKLSSEEYLVDEFVESEILVEF